MIIFRPHRSSLDETMKEAKEFDDVEKMKEYIVELWNRKWHGSQKLFTTDDIVITVIYKESKKLAFSIIINPTIPIKKTPIIDKIKKITLFLLFICYPSNFNKII